MRSLTHTQKMASKINCVKTFINDVPSGSHTYFFHVPAGTNTIDVPRNNPSQPSSIELQQRYIHSICVVFSSRCFCCASVFPRTVSSATYNAHFARHITFCLRPSHRVSPEFIVKCHRLKQQVLRLEVPPQNTKKTFVHGE